MKAFVVMCWIASKMESWAKSILPINTAFPPFCIYIENGHVRLPLLTISNNWTHFKSGILCPSLVKSQHSNLRARQLARTPRQKLVNCALGRNRSLETSLDDPTSTPSYNWWVLCWHMQKMMPKGWQIILSVPQSSLSEHARISRNILTTLLSQAAI